MDQNPILCKYCKAVITENDYFCPNCGKKLKDKPLATTVTKQIIVYLISALAPPFGLWYGYKYLKQNDSKSKKIAYAAIIITLVALVVTIKLSADIMSSINKSINQSMSQYDNLGF